MLCTSASLVAEHAPLDLLRKLASLERALERLLGLLRCFRAVQLADDLAGEALLHVHRVHRALASLRRISSISSDGTSVTSVK